MPSTSVSLCSQHPRSACRVPETRWGAAVCGTRSGSRVHRACVMAAALVKGSGIFSKQKWRSPRPSSRAACRRQCWEGPEGRAELGLEGLEEPACDCRIRDGERLIEASSNCDRVELSFNSTCLALKLVLREWMRKYSENRLRQYQGGGDFGEFSLCLRHVSEDKGEDPDLTCLARVRSPGGLRPVRVLIAVLLGHPSVMGAQSAQGWLGRVIQPLCSGSHTQNRS